MLKIPVEYDRHFAGSTCTFSKVVVSSTPRACTTLEHREGGKEGSQMLTASQLGEEEGNKREREMEKAQEGDRDFLH
jgi:hypothetical protein